MSDGPYRTLNMSRLWKALARRAANVAHSSEEVVEAIGIAVLDDWNSIRPEFIQKIRGTLGDHEMGDLFVGVAFDEISRLRSVSLNPIEALIADQACDVARDNMRGPDAYKEAVKRTIEEQIIRRSRQVEEHYLREAPSTVPSLRARLDAACSTVDLDQLYVGIANGIKAQSIVTKVDRSGLDEGVNL